MNTIRFGRLPQLCTQNSPSMNALQEVFRLSSKFQTSNSLFKETSVALSFFFQQIMGHIPPEFVDLINTHFS